LATSNKGASPATLAEALLAFQSEAPSLQKNAVNPHFKNSYISLDELMESVLPVLNKHGLVVLQFPTALERDTQKFDDGGSRVVLGEIPALRTKIIHAPSGESMEDVMPLMVAKSDPQGQGSAITYARRYSLMSVLGLVADNDDDGEAASGRSYGTTKKSSGTVKL